MHALGKIAVEQGSHEGTVPGIGKIIGVLYRIGGTGTGRMQGIELMQARLDGLSALPDLQTQLQIIARQ